MYAEEVLTHCPWKKTPRIAAGARIHDLRTVRQLHEAGVLPERAGREVIRAARPTGRTLLDMVRLGQLTPLEVATITNRAHPSRGSRGVGSA